MSRLYANQGNVSAGRIYGGRQNEEEQRQADNARLQSFVDSKADTSGNNMSRIPESVRETPIKDFVSERKADVNALVTGDVSIADVVRRMPANTIKVGDAITDVIIPGIRNFVVTTGSIFGEGLAYAIDKDVREQYRAGNLDILPTITSTTPKKMAMYTVAAGIETAIITKLPSVAGKSILARAGIGGVDGLGFAISEGIAKDRSAEDIVKTMPLYGISGSAIGILTPYLIPMLKAELNKMPGEVRGLFKSIYEEVKPPTRTLNPTSVTTEPTRIPISTPNSRYEQYLRKNGYEPYVVDDAMPTIDFGDGAPAGGRQAPSSALPNVDPETQAPFVAREGSIAERTARMTPEQRADFESRANSFDDQGYSPDVSMQRALGISENIRTNANNAVTDVVPNPSFRAVSNSVQGEAITSAPARQTEEIATASQARQASTDRIVPDEVDVEPVEVPMPLEVQRPNMPVGGGQRRVSTLAADLVEDIEEIRKISPERAEKMGIATYQQADMAQQARMASDLVERDVDLALRVAKGEATVPGLLDNAVVMALSRFARNTGDAKLAIRTASLRATRMGQELRALVREQGLIDDPIEIMAEITQRRKEKVGGGVGNFSDKQKLANFQAKKRTIMNGANKTLTTAQLKMAEAQKVIDDILC